MGTAAIQIAAHLGARTIVTAGGAARCSRCLELGADVAIDHRTDDFLDGALDATGGRGVDVVLDCIGAPYLDRNLGVLRRDGRLVLIGMMGGTRAEIDLSRLLARRLSVVGSTLRSRTADFKAGLWARFLERFGPALATDEIRPVIDRVLPIEDVAEAHRLMAAGAVFGKLVLKV